MRRMIALLLIVLLCLPLCACGEITYNEDFSEIYYNGRTYVNSHELYDNYRVDHYDAGWEEIGWIPYSKMLYVILHAKTVFYGNNADNPEFITNNRTDELYVREDITLDHNTRVWISDCREPYSFTFSEITTGSVIEFNQEQKYTYREVCNFFVTLDDCPLIEQWYWVYQVGGSYYIQDDYDSDFYQLTNEFVETIYDLGLDEYDYS